MAKKGEVNKWKAIETDDTKRPNRKIVLIDELPSDDLDFIENVGIPYGIVLLGAEFGQVESDS